MKMTIDVPKEIEKEMFERVKGDIPTILDLINKSNIPILALLHASNFYKEAEDVADREVSSLSNGEKLALALKWLFYDHLL